MICGSANANERSMRAQGGDNEIAVFNQPAPGHESACEKQIIAHRTKMFKETLGPLFIKNHPGCIEHPELFAKEIRMHAESNFAHFYRNNQAMDKIPGASQWMAWPFIYSNEIGHVGEYKSDYPQLVDTPYSKEKEDSFQWHPNTTPPAAQLLSVLGLRVFA